MPELVCSVPTLRVFESIDLAPFDALYLGQPFCVKVEGNLIIDLPALRSCISTLHEKGKKAYLSTPVVPSSHELNRTAVAIAAAVESGIDGIEVHDMGVFRQIRSSFPDVPVHVGHFANIYHIETAKVLGSMGAARLAPSYELTLEEKSAFLQLRADGMALEIPVAGKLPIGMAHTCLLRMSFPSRTQLPCTQQCAERRELEFTGQSWKMRSAGTAMVMAEDLVMIEHLAELTTLGYDAFRMETSLESAEKISALGRSYRAALDDAQSGRPFDQTNLDAVSGLAEAGLCNGWYFGQSGREYVEALNV